MDKFKIVNEIGNNLEYHSRSWNHETINKYILKHPKGFHLEASLIKHFKDNNLRDITIELSNMYGCPIRCKYCASNQINNYKKLKPGDYLEQINIILKDQKLNIDEYENFYVSFAGIGEPSLIPEEIAEGALLINNQINHVRFNIATFGLNNNSFKIWGEKNLPIRRVQIPFIHYHTNKLKFIVKNINDDYNILNVIEQAKYLVKSQIHCQLKINFLLIEDFNDSIVDIDRTINYLKKFRDDIIIKISILNETISSRYYNLQSPEIDTMKNICKRFIENKFHSYIFGPKKNNNFGCGQLISQYEQDV